MMSSKKYWQVSNTFNKKLELKKNMTDSLINTAKYFFKSDLFTFKSSLYVPLKSNTKHRNNFIEQLISKHV